MSVQTVDRKLTVVLYADVAGYSRLTGQDEAGTHHRVMKTMDFASECINSSGGMVLRYAGDAILAEFGSVLVAVTSAITIQKQLHEENMPGDPADRVEVRIGINLGEVISDRNEIYGDGVNIAARLEALAHPGGICISSTVHEQIAGKLGAEFIDGGERSLKNINRPVRVFQWHPEKTEPVIREETPPLPDKPSIAILPFKNMSGDPAQEFFSDGVTEDIITSLSRFSGIFVISRNSSFSFKGQSVNIKQVADSLGVRYVLEGSIQRAANRIRINAQLIDSVTDAHVWAERFDREIEDIFELQDEIARNIVGNVGAQVEAAEVARSRTLPALDLSSYEISLKAEALFFDGCRSGKPEDIDAARAVAQSALDIDARNIHALWTLSYVYSMRFVMRWGDPDENLEQAGLAADTILHADSLDPRGFMMRGFVLALKREFEGAIADFRRAHELNPNYAKNLFVMAWGESIAGLTREAIEHAELGLRLSPRDLDLWTGDAYLALLQAYFAEQDYEQAMAAGIKAVQLGPKAPIRRALMIALSAYRGDQDSVRQHVDVLNSFAPDFIPSLLSGSLTLYKLEQHNTLLVEGLKKAGFS